MSKNSDMSAEQLKKKLTDIGMNRNSSDWLGMNSYPILSPGLPTSCENTTFRKRRLNINDRIKHDWRNLRFNLGYTRAHF